jgi:hypothetical protein
MIGAVLFCDGQFLVASAKRHDRWPRRQQLGILDCVSAQAADTDHGQNPVRPEGARVPQFLDASIRRQSCVGERRQFFGFQVVFFVDADSVRLRLMMAAPIVACPCGAVSSPSVHGRYQRHLTGLPWGTWAIRQRRPDAEVTGM